MPIRLLRSRVQTKKAMIEVSTLVLYRVAKWHVLSWLLRLEGYQLCGVDGNQMDEGLDQVASQEDFVLCSQWGFL
jgi:hypothetical protein